MKKTNYGYFADVSHPNWTLRTPRQMTRQTHYKRADDRIPASGWILAAILVFGVFGFLPLLNWVMK